MTNHELTKRELAQREQIFLREHSEIGVVASEPAKPHPESAAPAEPLPAEPLHASDALDAFAPEVRAPQSRSPIPPLPATSGVHPVALTCLAIVTALFAFVLVERSTDPVVPPRPEEPAAVISEADTVTPPLVSADTPPPADVAPAPSTPLPVPEIDVAPAGPVAPLTPRPDSPRARPSAPSISKQPPSTARLNLEPPLSQRPPLSQTPPAVAVEPPPPSRPTADVSADPPAAAAARASTPIAEPDLSPAPAPSFAAPPAVAVPAPPPAAVAVASASAKAIDSNTRSIENTLARYRKAFSALDASAARAVWPTVNQRTLSRAFERLEKQDVSFEGCQIDVAEARAEANCIGTASYVPRIGNRTPQVDRRLWRFSLVKARDEWLIGAVDAQ